MLRALCAIVREARRRGKPVSVCGEMAADPAAAIFFSARHREAQHERISPAAYQVGHTEFLKRSYEANRRQSPAHESAKSIRQMLSGELEQAGLGDLIRVGT